MCQFEAGVGSELIDNERVEESGCTGAALLRALKWSKRKSEEDEEEVQRDVEERRE